MLQRPPSVHARGGFLLFALTQMGPIDAKARPKP